MAWLHSSFARQQTQNESQRNNLRKGYKVALSNKDIDPDNCDTPLLHDTPTNSDQKVLNSDWFGNGSLASRNQNITKTSFSASLFNKSGGSGNPKNQTTPISSGENVNQHKISMEDKTLLKAKEEEKSNQFEEEYDEDSEDEWCLPTSGGYQKVRSGAD